MTLQVWIRSSLQTLRQQARRYLALNLWIYSGLVLGALLGFVFPQWVWDVAGLGTWAAPSGPAEGGAILDGIQCLLGHWLVLAALILAANLTLVTLSIVLGTLWWPIIIPLGTLFAIEVAGVTMVYAALQPPSLLALLPLLLLESQAVIVGLVIALELGRRAGSLGERLKGWSEYLPLYLWIPILLVAAGVWEAYLLMAWAR
jgi:hypothetical protein